MPNGIIHIGLPKTGTTSVQSAVYKHRDRLLAEFGIFYPWISENLTDILCTAFHDDPRKHINVRLAGANTIEKAELLRSQSLAAIERHGKPLFFRPKALPILITTN
ncbi:hypothetical protein NKI38_25850 [Mesorhizobium sp. M0621]|uniref:hypothetical protein n=1 Tax=Mesorhizobium sp. M0621 TaxID=2956974 RepID=UPI0033356D20